MGGWVGVRACVRACVRVCVCACVCIRLDLSFYSVDFNRTDLIFFVFFFFCLMAGNNPFFVCGSMRFCFISNFRFSYLFLPFLNYRIEIFKSDGYHS